MCRQSYFREVSPVAMQRMKDNCCPNCGKPKSEWKRRTDWRCCSTECTTNYYKEFDTSYSWQTFRLKIFKRDNGTCVKCNRQFLRKSWRTNNLELPDESKLIADHIIPIELGGEMWDMINIQTLCIDCNRIKTKQDMGNIAVHRERRKRWHERTDRPERLLNLSLLDKWF